tara:strand:+ start:122 stop:346 length:225 start_codon:yes stop_codon:yes gene_type:complete
VIELAGGIIIAAGVLFAIVAFFPLLAAVFRIGAVIGLIAVVVAVLSWRTPPTFWLIALGVFVAWNIHNDYGSKE